MLYFVDCLNTFESDGLYRFETPRGPTGSPYAPMLVIWLCRMIDEWGNAVFLSAGIGSAACLEYCKYGMYNPEKSEIISDYIIK